MTEFNDLIILKEIPGITKAELETFKSIKKAWDDIEAGKAKKLSIEEFLKELKRW